MTEIELLHQRLEEKDNDLDLSTEIGKQLMEENEALKTQNAELEDALSVETLDKMKMQSEVEFMKARLQHGEDDGGADSPAAADAQTAIDGLKVAQLQKALQQVQAQLN